MKMVIFGANGPVGRLLTQQALNEQHHVCAVTRHPDAFPIRHARLTVAHGDVYDAADVARAMVGQEVVLSLVGVPYTLKPVSVYSQGMMQIIPAMQVAGIRRLVCVTSVGTYPHYDPREGFIYGRIIKPLFGRTLYIDMRRMEKIVMQSDRDWTILRPAQLVDSSAITNYRLQEGFMMAGSHKTARADLADGMLKQASSDQYLHKAIAIATFA